MAFNNERQDLNNFIYALRIEFDLLIDYLKNEENVNVKDIKRIFCKQKLTRAFLDRKTDKVNLTEESADKLLKIVIEI